MLLGSCLLEGLMLFGDRRPIRGLIVRGTNDVAGQHGFFTRRAYKPKLIGMR